MSDFFSFPEKESLCQKNAETVKVEFCGMEKAGVQIGSICSITLTAQVKGISESGDNPTTAQKVRSVICQLFENVVMDNVIRVNPASNAFRNFRKTAELNPACREPFTVEQQEALL